MNCEQLPYILASISTLILGFVLPFGFPLIFKRYIKALKWRLKEAKEKGY